jgi:hypothetical protein
VSKNCIQCVKNERTGLDLLCDECREQRPKTLDQQLTRAALVRSLRSTLCPACGGAKKSMHSLCLRDYRRLPKALRDGLWANVGAGYREGMADAMTFLERTEFKLPTE